MKKIIFATLLFVPISAFALTGGTYVSGQTITTVSCSNSGNSVNFYPNNSSGTTPDWTALCQDVDPNNGFPMQVDYLVLSALGGSFPSTYYAVETDLSGSCDSTSTYQDCIDYGLGSATFNFTDSFVAGVGSVSTGLASDLGTQTLMVFIAIVALIGSLIVFWLAIKKIKRALK